MQPRKIQSFAVSDDAMKVISQIQATKKGKEENCEIAFEQVAPAFEKLSIQDLRSSKSSPASDKNPAFAAHVEKVVPKVQTIVLDQMIALTRAALLSWLNRLEKYKGDEVCEYFLGLFSATVDPSMLTIPSAPLTLLGIQMKVFVYPYQQESPETNSYYSLVLQNCATKLSCSFIMFQMQQTDAPRVWPVNIPITLPNSTSSKKCYRLLPPRICRPNVCGDTELVWKQNHVASNVATMDGLAKYLNSLC